jgi:hypothetical protein
MTSATSLWPREHGAYAELGFPLATGLVLGGLSVAGGCIALGAVLVFVAHEPLAVITGTRGARRQVEAGRAARRRFVRLAAGAMVAGGVGVLLGGTGVRSAAMVPLVPAVAALPWLVRGRQKSLSAELLIVAAFAGTALPLVVAGGRGWAVGSIVAGVWLVCFALETLAVHRLKLYHKRRRGALGLRTGIVVLSVTVSAVALVATVAGSMPALVAAALAPPTFVSVAVALVPVHPRRLKAVGWSLVCANAVTLICLVLL